MSTTLSDSQDVLLWIDTRGGRQRASFDVPDDSPLYQFVGGEKVSIRYNPVNPEEYYFRELLQTRVRTFVKRATIVLLFIGIVVVGGWLRVRYLVH